MPVSSSIALAVCCRLLAVNSVRWLRSPLPWAISPEAVAMESVLARTVAMAVSMRRRASIICTAAGAGRATSMARKSIEPSAAVSRSAIAESCWLAAKSTRARAAIMIRIADSPTT